MERNIRPTAMVTCFRAIRRRVHKREPGDMAGLAHKIVNQLTVINLTCFKLRAVVKHTSAVDPVDIARLENAVDEMHGLVESLVGLEARMNGLNQLETRPSRRQRAKAGNLYRLSEAQQPKR
jgi:hypothetical protein